MEYLLVSVREVLLSYRLYEILKMVISTHSSFFGRYNSNRKSKLLSGTYDSSFYHVSKVENNATSHFMLFSFHDLCHGRKKAQGTTRALIYILFLNIRLNA